MHITGFGSGEVFGSGGTVDMWGRKIGPSVQQTGYALNDNANIFKDLITGDFAGIGKDAKKFSQHFGGIFGVGGASPADLKAAPPTPNRGEAILTALAGQKRDLSSMRASDSLMTGGQGVLDTPMTASRVLLGS